VRRPAPAWKRGGAPPRRQPRHVAAHRSRRSSRPRSSRPNTAHRWIAAALFAIVAYSDTVDGRIARRFGIRPRPPAARSIAPDIIALNDGAGTHVDRVAPRVVGVGRGGGAFARTPSIGCRPAPAAMERRPRRPWRRRASPTGCWWRPRRQSHGRSRLVAPGGDPALCAAVPVYSGIATPAARRAAVSRQRQAGVAGPISVADAAAALREHPVQEEEADQQRQ
jgi:hypothetical protein